MTPCIVTASEDTTARVWDLLFPTAGSPPEWFPDFLRYLAQMRLNPDGELETLKAVDWLALRERLRGARRASASAGHGLPAHSPQIGARVASHFGLRWQSATTTPLSQVTGWIEISSRITRLKSAVASDLPAHSKTWRTYARDTHESELVRMIGHPDMEYRQDRTGLPQSFPHPIPLDLKSVSVVDDATGIGGVRSKQLTIATLK